MNSECKHDFESGYEESDILELKNQILYFSSHWHQIVNTYVYGERKTRARKWARICKKCGYKECCYEKDGEEKQRTHIIFSPICKECENLFSQCSSCSSFTDKLFECETCRRIGCNNCINHLSSKKCTKFCQIVEQREMRKMMEKMIEMMMYAPGGEISKSAEEHFNKLLE